MDDEKNNKQRTNLEVIAPSIEEAIEKGLAELGVTDQEVDVEVLDSGSRGLFGLGSRQARVRLILKEATKQEEKPVAAAIPLPMPVPAGVISPAEKPGKRLPKETVSGETIAKEQVEPSSEISDSEQVGDQVLQTAQATIEELLEKMKIRAKVSARYIEAQDEQSKTVVWVDIRGEDLSILIGPKAETLNALQFIAGLIVNKELGHSIPLTVDVQGYRARREQQIRQLARRMAEQATKTGRRQVLEPMPANERRLVHMELRGHPEVTTESIGEDPHRKVTIIPKH
jgi:spoIIIJ-associated protein